MGGIGSWPTTTKVGLFLVIALFVGAGLAVPRLTAEEGGAETVNAQGAAAESGAGTGTGTGTGAGAGKPATTRATRPPTTGAARAATTTTADHRLLAESRVVAANTDGDTMRLSDGARVRLVGINAPDIGHCYSTEAADQLRKLLPPDTRIRLEYGPETIDTFGRTLAYVFRTSDGLFVNKAMVEEGFALEEPAWPNVDHVDEIRSAQRTAESGRKGMWRSCQQPTGSVVNPAAPR